MAPFLYALGAIVATIHDIRGKKIKKAANGQGTDPSAVSFDPPPEVKSRATMPRADMNKTEQAYAEHLEERRQAGEIIWWAFEPMKLRLAKNTTYTPDFGVVVRDGTYECHEVKGFWRDDARVKIKVAAYHHPFVFVAVTKQSKKNGGGWDVERF